MKETIWSINSSLRLQMVPEMLRNEILTTSIENPILKLLSTFSSVAGEFRQSTRLFLTLKLRKITKKKHQFFQMPNHFTQYMEQRETIFSREKTKKQPRTKT